MDDNFQEIKTELKAKYAYVAFNIDGTSYKLRKDKTLLPQKKGLWNNYPFVNIDGMDIVFPATNTKLQIEKLRSFWTSLVENGFEQV